MDLTWISAISWGAVLARAFRIAAILIVAYLGWHLIKRVLNRVENIWAKHKNGGDESAQEAMKRFSTVFQLLRGTIITIIIIITALVMLREIGYDITPILASAGIVGLAISFGAQSLFRDIICGIFMLLESQVRIGDVAIINGQAGIVQHVHLRTTVLRDLSGVVHVFPNGGITSLSNMTYEWSAYVLKIGVAYKEDVDHVMQVMNEVGQQMTEDPEYGALMISDLEMAGVDEFADSAVIIKARLLTKPLSQWKVGREYNRRIKKRFDQEGIEIPFPHRTIYWGEASQPFEVQSVESETASVSSS